MYKEEMKRSDAKKFMNSGLRRIVLLLYKLSRTTLHTNVPPTTVNTTSLTRRGPYLQVLVEKVKESGSLDIEAEIS